MNRSQGAAFGFLLFVLIGLVATNVGADARRQPVAADGNLRLVAAPPTFGPAPEATGLTGWLNTAGAPGPALSGSTGTVRLVVFWSSDCGPCRSSITGLNSIDDRWRAKGLVTVGVHSPALTADANPLAVEAEAVGLGIDWPVALDRERTTFESWQGPRRFWPRLFVVDQNGAIRFDWIGGGGWNEAEAVVAHLVENGP